MSDASKRTLYKGYPRWSEAEDAILREYYPAEGAKAARRLPSRTKAACMCRVRKLGLYFDGDPISVRGRRRDAWTKAEEGVLREHYRAEGTRVYLRLNGRSRDACRVRAEKLGLKTVVPWGKPKKG